MHHHRQSALQSILTQEHADACLITNAKNIFYLTGFAGISPYERESIFLTTKEHGNFLFVPPMYAEHAHNTVDATNITIISSIPHGLFGTAVTHTACNTILCESDNLTYSEYACLTAKTRATLMPKKNLVEPLRLKKDVQEIAWLKKAAAITDAAYAHIVTYIQTHIATGLREHDVKEELRRFALAAGSEGCGFDTIVAAGAGSSQPHYISQNKKLERGEPLLIDMGFLYQGYTADFTRTMFLGTPTPLYTEIYTLVKECQQTCLDACRPGISTKELYTRSLEYFTRSGKESLYLHSLGHGVGLDVHESPSLSPSGNTILEPGMVITIEPGLYREKNFGVRIEDLLLITDDGYELFTKSSKQLTSIAY